MYGTVLSFLPLGVMKTLLKYVQRVESFQKYLHSISNPVIHATCHSIPTPVIHATCHSIPTPVIHD